MHASDECLSNRNILQVLFSLTTILLINPHALSPFQTSPSRNLITTDSQGKNLTFPIFNILVLPGAQVGDVRPFLPVKGRYYLIVLFIGGNNFSTGNTCTLAKNISDLVVAASEVALRIFVIAVPPQLVNPGQVKALYRLL